MNNLPTTTQDLLPGKTQDDRAKNTLMLKEVPGLSETITPQLGNIIFIPGLEEDYGKEYRTLVIDIDGKDQIVYKPSHAATRASLSVYPGEAFDYEGAEYLFRHVGGIPLVYKQAAFALAVHRCDENLLEIAFTPDERQAIRLEYDHALNLLEQDNRVHPQGDSVHAERSNIPEELAEPVSN